MSTTSSLTSVDTPTSAVDRLAFGSLTELQDRHAELVKSVAADVFAPGNLDRVSAFINRAAATGRILDLSEDRTQAQGLINFWVARLSSAARKADPAKAAAIPRFDDTLLHEFDADTIRSATAAADEKIRSLPPADQDLARRVMLRLLRLLPGRSTFEAVPTIKAALADLDSPERVNDILEALVATGVVRKKAGETPELDRYALRSPALATNWNTLQTWEAGRLDFRDKVGEWKKAGRPANLLATGDTLEEAKRYHDRDEQEREFVNQSTYKQARVLEQAVSDRRQKWLWRGLAIVACIGWLGTIISSGRAVVISQHLDKAAGNLVIEQDKVKETTTKLEKSNENKLRWSASIQLSRALGAAIAARTQPEWDLAKERLELVIQQMESIEDLKKFLTPANELVLKEIRANLSFGDNERPEAQVKLASDQKNKGRVYNLVHDLRDRLLANDKEMNDYAVVMRNLPYKTVLYCSDSITSSLEKKRPSKAEASINEFWTLYWGEMLMFEGPKVEMAMMHFGEALKPFDDLRKKPISVVQLKKSLEALVIQPAKIKQLDHDLQVYGANFQVLNEVLQEGQKMPDLAALVKFRDMLRDAINTELKSKTIVPRNSVEQVATR